MHAPAALSRRVQDANESGDFGFCLVSMRPLTTAPSARLTLGAATSPLTVAEFSMTIFAVAVSSPLARPETMMVSALTVASSAPPASMVSGFR